MNLESFILDEPAAHRWLAGKAETVQPPLINLTEWSPAEIGQEAEAIYLIESAQQHQYLTGPGTLALLYTNDPDSDLYRILIDLTAHERQDDDRHDDQGDGGSLHLISDAYEWAMIVPHGQTGFHAALTILTGATAEANGLLRDLKNFTASAEQAAYEQAKQDALEVTDGIERFSTCGCGEPVALYEGEWLHVYNDRLRGTDDHDPHPEAT